MIVTSAAIVTPSMGMMMQIEIKMMLTRAVIVTPLLVMMMENKIRMTTWYMHKPSSAIEGLNISLILVMVIIIILLG